MAVSVEKKQRKHPWWSGFVSKIKRNILRRMFSGVFSQNFQNNHFVKHFRLAAFLIY